MAQSIKRIFSIDIGGTNIKVSILSSDGKLLSEYTKLPTPHPATPTAVMKVIKTLAGKQQYDVVSAGFPGYIKNGVVITAPNLDTEHWHNKNLQSLLEKTLGKPARVGNDADLLGLGVIKGTGLEMVITLGTGFGTGLYLNGKLLPHLELAHHPISAKNTYDSYLGDLAFHKKGKKKWNKRLKDTLDILKTVFNYDTLYIGGGNASKIDFPLEKNMVLFTNLDGIDGGAKLWKQ